MTTRRSWDFFPALSFSLSDKWSVGFYQESGISYDTRTQNWFVPIEAMLTHRVDRNWEYAFGGAYELVDDNPSYRWLVQGRLRYYYR